MRLFRNKISILLSVAALVCIGIITFLYLYFSSSVERIKRSYAETQMQMLYNQLKVNAEPTDKAILALAGATDMKPCAIISAGLPVDIRERLSIAGINFVVITDRKLLPIGGYPGSKEQKLSLLPSDSAVFRKIESDGKITRYYGWFNDSIYEISATKISWCNNIREDSLVGWLFVGKPIGSEFTDKILLQQPGSVTLKKEFELASSVNYQKSNTIITNLPLLGWNNRPVASLKLETTPELMKVLSTHQRMLLIVMLLSAAAFLIFIAFYLKRYYILPLKLISLALKYKDPEYIKMVSDTDPDLNALQNMLMNVFSQERMLTDMMKRRSTERMNLFHAAILSRISEAVYATDHKGVITYWNKAAESLYRTIEANAVSKISAVLIRNKWASPDEEEIQTKELKSTGFWQGNLKQEIPNGSEISVEASISCMYDNKGSLLGNLTIVRKSS